MPSKVREVGISESPLSVDHALGLVSGPAVGGIALFVGTVRSSDHGAGVVSLDYTQHPSAVEVLAKCAEETADHHDVLAIAVEHRVGHLEIGDIAVVVAVGAVHRGEALAACAHLINALKAEVPIWKEQHFTSGGSEWVGLSDEDGELHAQSAEFQAEGAEAHAQGGAEAHGQGEEAQAQGAVR
jgi:molybdopterin synthase catalytic subunit